MKNKILGFLFVAYRDPNSTTFASWWLNLHGRVLIGSPKKAFTERGIAAPLIKSYYYTKDDRSMEGVNTVRWMEDSIFVNAYRRYQEQAVAVAAARGAIVVCMLALGVVGIVGAGKAGTEKVSQGIGWVKDAVTGKSPIEFGGGQ